MPADAVLPTLKLWTKAGLLPGLSEESCQLLDLPRRAPAGQSSEVHAAQRALACDLVQPCTAHTLARSFRQQGVFLQTALHPRDQCPAGAEWQPHARAAQVLTVLPEVAGNRAPGVPRLLARLPSPLRDRVGLRGRPVSRACCICFCSLM